MEGSGTWFREWFSSPYYHLLYFNRNENEASSFINTLVNHLSPPPSSIILDVACGKGRHSRLLADKGFDVTGIDLSFTNINEALPYETDHLRFYQHDMRLPFSVNYFDYAFNFFTSFGYFNTEREHYNAVRTIAGALKPGGVLVLDYFNVHYAEDHLLHISENTIGEVTF
ncbi:MAG: methyltransferase domain-containing protein, partial [Chitinophagaceae bacterium]|nr:methyltransferase domain-containing protein [Chitinophagaceae bacterium]